MEWIKVCDINSLNDNNIVTIDHNDKKIMVVKIQDKIYASDRICTHAYADLSTGFLNEEDKAITCPLHLSAFTLNNGIPQNPPAEDPIKTYTTKTENNDVFILI